MWHLLSLQPELSELTIEHLCFKVTEISLSLYIPGASLGMEPHLTPLSLMLSPHL